MSLKVGDKINIQKQETTVESTFNDILSVLRSPKMKEADKLQWCQSLLSILENYFKEDGLKSVQNAKKYAIPVLHSLTEKSSIENMSTFFDYYKKLYCFCARSDFECFVDYIEFNQPKKVLANRREVLKPYVDALNRIAFDDKLQYIIVSYPPSMGKCIEKNTPIWTPKGYVPIKDLNIGDEVYSMLNNEIVIEKVTNKWETRKKQYKIKLKSGKEIIISPEHRMLTFDGYKKASELKNGDYFYSYLKETEGNICINEDELLFITCMIFEGHCKISGMSYTGEENEITREFLKCCKKLEIPYSKDIRENNKAYVYRLLQGNNKNNINLLEKYGLLGHLCYTKRLPQCFYTMPLKQKYKFIGIILATDGYITKDNAGITLANEKLIDDIQFLLNTCGIYSRKRNKSRNGFKSWEILIPKEYVLQLKDKIYCYQKQAKMLAVEENKILHRGNLSVKYPKQIFRNIKPNGIRGGFDKKWHMERDVDRTILYFENMSKEFKELEQYRYKDFYWEEIIDIQYIDKEIDMVDIEVSNTHNFIANGYVSHNSYLATLFTAWGYGLSINNSVIRMSYSDELVLGFSRTVKGIISSPEFAEIFPLFKLYNGKPFEVERESDWKIKNANVPKSNHIARTRSGSTTGERASFAIIFDDMTKGAEEANSESIHKGIYDKWLTEWWNRRDGQKCKFIFVGTQWTPEDILNRVIEDRNKVSPLQETNNPYVMESEDKSTIVIRVPMLDKNHKTTCSEVYPQEIAEQIEQNTDPFLFSCVYQQDPIAPTGRELAWECLQTYINPPDDLESYCMAVIDTKRKGKDNLNMFICKPDGHGKHYLWDAIFSKKPMQGLYDDIIDKIIFHRITTLVIENNTDESLKTLLEDRLHKKGCYWCTVIEKFNTKKKETRIKDNLWTILTLIVFKDKSIVKPNTDIGRLMDNITKYSFDKPNAFDDGPDGSALYASEIIMGKSVLPKAKAFKRTF